MPGGEAKFEALDADGKGFILFDEFAAWALKLQVAKAGGSARLALGAKKAAALQLQPHAHASRPGRPIRDRGLR